MTLSNPFAQFAVTQGWKPGHEAVDYATPYGFVFTSPDDGTYHHLGGSTAYSGTPGTPGLWGEIRLADGSKIRFAHLSRHIAADGARVQGGITELAATGNSGYVIPRPTKDNPRAGSHEHTYGLDPRGKRWNWTLSVRPASTVSQPQPLEEPDMPGPIFMTPNIVSFPNGYTTSLEPDAWKALKGRFEQPDNPAWDWCTQWAVDLTWQANNFMLAREVEAIVKAIPSSDINADEAQLIAEKVIAGMPDRAPETVTPSDVADELTRRLHEWVPNQ